MTRDDIIHMAREAGFRAGCIELYNGDPLPFIAPRTACPRLSDSRLSSQPQSARRAQKVVRPLWPALSPKRNGLMATSKRPRTSQKESAHEAARDRRPVGSMATAAPDTARQPRRPATDHPTAAPATFPATAPASSTAVSENARRGTADSATRPATAAAMSFFLCIGRLCSMAAGFAIGRR